MTDKTKRAAAPRTALLDALRRAGACHGWVRRLRNKSPREAFAIVLRHDMREPPHILSALPWLAMRLAGDRVTDCVCGSCHPEFAIALTGLPFDAWMSAAKAAGWLP